MVQQDGGPNIRYCNHYERIKNKNIHHIEKKVAQTLLKKKSKIAKLLKDKR